ncbi:VOC family protein [Bacillus sp. 165]|uniref:VOC family protein n=1 Tax=Bacillus sp. 165 TaxID=1529117 RepID=UPI001ADA288B|nr:VOC family protein [Bacillus sp. 165]MBO9130746.1 VOC family protein [Bacillus sp. 165]
MKICVKRIHHIQICIPFGKEAEARSFYTDVLGFTEIEKPASLKENGGLWYEARNAELHIGVENMQSYNSKCHPAFEIENILAARSYLEAHGVQTKEEKPIPGIIRFSFRDPFNNRIEFLEKEL